MSPKEQTLLLGPAKHIVATCTGALPSQTQRPPVVALLTNSGVIPRSGPNRMNVHLARHFAAMGIPSVRFDLTGLGDSGRPATPLPLMAQWVADTRSVMDHAAEQHGCDRFLMVGFCSGAEVAHLVALEDARLRGAVLWDLYAYPTPASKLLSLAYRLQRLGCRGAARKAAQRLTALLSRQPPAAPQAKAMASTVPDRAVYAQRIQTLVDQGVALHIAFGEGNQTWFNHSGQFRAMFSGQRFLAQVDFSFLTETDHLLTTTEGQQAFLRMTDHWVRRHFLNA